MVFRPIYPWYFDQLPMVCRPPYTLYFEPPMRGILTPYQWYVEPLPMVYRHSYPWYKDPFTHGILTPLPVVFWLPINGISTPYPWYFDPLPMVFWSPYPWNIDPLFRGILTPLPMVYRTPYLWYFDPLSMVFWTPAYLLIRNEGVKIPWGWIYHTGGSVFNKWGQNTIWHRSFLHSWTNIGFVIRLTRWEPLLEQEQLTFPEHPSSVPVFSGVCFTRSLVLCLCVVDHRLSFLPLSCPSFDLWIRITPFGFGILKLFFRKAVIHFPIGSYVKKCPMLES